MNRIFGYGGRKNHDQLLQDSNKAMNEAQQSMQERISGLDTQISQLNVQLQAIQRKISGTSSAAGQKPLRQRALKLLNKRKQLESMRDSLDSQSWSMNQAQMTSDNLRNTMVTVNALKQTNKALKAQYGKINIDKLQDMQDEMLDLVEQGEELQNVLAMGSGVQDLDDISETELDAELEALGDGSMMQGDMAYEGETSGEIPSYLSGTIPQFVDEEPSAEMPGKLETAT
ncbi:LANO_0A05424g1_1 [Lachancea nothofagi CBS 11611]|uniref:LANO_0A05424g1_1 n=1 Tax=Lachancea nothofagi CBS 11611 TaxID=1266666 RepID=A0A1G4IRJ4_9SACH|nr:LANO_0A05424g1_1 [Lachancea nothofagi CBS 11611]